jgi:hypothetical protein
MAVFIISCTGNSSKVSKLDKQNGFYGFVLGDSNYNSFIHKIRNASTYYNVIYNNSNYVIKRKIFGFVIVPLKKIEKWDHKFIYGIPMRSLSASSLNRQIYKYSIDNNNLVSFAQDILLDSLIENYGSPTSKKDTTYFWGKYISGISVKHKRVWDGKKIKLIYSWGNDHETSIQVIDKGAEKIIQKIGDKIISLKNKPPHNLANLKWIGNLTINSTEKELIAENALTDTSFTLTSIDYDRFLESFFNIKNKNGSISNEIRFYDLAGIGNRDSSFTALTVSFDKASTSFRYGSKINYQSLLDLLEKKFGTYSFEEKIYTRYQGVLRRSFWLSSNLTIILTDERKEVEVKFFKNDDIPPPSLSGFMTMKEFEDKL